MTNPKPRGRPVGFYKPASLQPNESVGYLMKRVIASIGSQADAELEPEGLTHAQWVPLFKLYTGDAATAAELAGACDLDAGAMTRTLDRLEAKALIRRVRSAEDRRVVNLELTPEGRSTAERVPAALCKVLNAHLRGFSAEEWQTLKSLLQRMLQNALELQAERENVAHEA
ncbi:MAG TPA: MarR family transcriptional regulator [Ramlibacter sp.]|uniref:MarR family winged helix-turn-helix transcriptional regulator n=1 Tax=Ramlibacter sp. TaxID=1917967 RepID=UPI002C8E8E05|nr:MarR family transcriptional regulator [Ramlibacter sp.]HVZ42912.1 MarR family transcriptional regulator [Ramlibacter sp.]